MLSPSVSKNTACTPSSTGARSLSPRSATTFWVPSGKTASGLRVRTRVWPAWAGRSAAMSSDPMWPVAPVIKIMSSGPLLVIGFWGEVGWAQLRREGAAPREDAVGLGEVVAGEVQVGADRRRRGVDDRGVDHDHDLRHRQQEREILGAGLCAIIGACLASGPGPTGPRRQIAGGARFGSRSGGL